MLSFIRRSSTLATSRGLLSPAEFVKLRAGQRVVALDATWYLPNAGRDGRAEFAQERLPGARFFDIDAVKDTESPYPHMLPSTATFSAAMGALGVRADDTVVVYDKQGNFSAPRLFWTLKVFQHPSVYLLDNYPAYKAAGYEVETGTPAEPAPETYTAVGRDDDLVISFEDLASIVREPLLRRQLAMVDARPQARWAGAAPEPRPGLPSGHVPDSQSVPFTDVLDPETKQFLPAAELRRVFAARGVDGSRPVVAMCGTGVTACILETALIKAGLTDKPIVVYDGSWTEWAQRAPSAHIVSE
ncbi:Rhodanese-like domain-containing protein [Dipodascopsis tothii]|uniref:Rhodanese-like domain-containing protein n=1 Tax=Dipodascopsis tothii TaxID=44089 RepID=UPI0034CFE301